MARRALWLTAIAALIFSARGAGALPPDEGVPIYEPAVVEIIPGGACTSESRFDAPNRYFVDAEGKMVAPETPGARSACERLRLVFGPIIAKPGQNDVLIQPVTFEKPLYDGHLVRFKPDLVSYDGTPPVEDIHLHHGTWLNTPEIGREYGSGPWIASGEEKTIAVWPERFGLNILADDQWLFLHMVHNALPTPRPVWVTYDLDFVTDADAAVVQADGEPLIRNTKGIWLDVGGSRFHPDTETYPFNPVFNAHRGMGAVNAETGGLECSFPARNCAMFNSLGNTSAQQGNDVTADPLGPSWTAPTVLGKDWQVPYGFLGGTEANPGVGTIVMMGGHVHNGGLRDEVELVRDLDGDKKWEADEGRLIHISDAYYWDYDNPDRIGAPPVSWDFSMTGTIRDLGWSINVREGDVLRLNGIYETEIGSWYEQMGIVMAWVVPGEEIGSDVFAKDGNGNYIVTLDTGIPTTAQVPNGPDGTALARTCSPTATTLCTRGQIGHGHVDTSGNHATCGPAGCGSFPGADIDGPLMTEIHVGGFTFGQADYGITGLTGVPRVTLGEPVRFVNIDTADYMWHTVTRCAAPCTGGTSASYPIADGAWTDLLGRQPTQAELLDMGGGFADPMDFDSSELGVGLAPSGRIDWTFTPTRTGLFTFFCRIHPGMRGAFRVVE